MNARTITGCDACALFRLSDTVVSLTGKRCQRPGTAMDYATGAPEPINQPIAQERAPQGWISALYHGRRCGPDARFFEAKVEGEQTA